MSVRTCRGRLTVPCHVGDPDLWFAESPTELEQAKALCAECPIRRECL
ncbi:MAG: WhiB family transcriptional regulator, redox-sensing transcriptional regulator, partial [Mycobacterium sp.]|nr:WhiB family transcriptional regulator, redox-sensing transcriptional regulator [Mycobacterium sp.]